MACCIDDSRNQNTSNSFSSYPPRRPINSPKCRITKILRPNSSNLVSCAQKISDPAKVVPQDGYGNDPIWLKIREESNSDVEQEPILSTYFDSLILSHDSLESALANLLAQKLSNSNLSTDALYRVFYGAMNRDCDIKIAIREDLKAVKERDPVCISYVHCFLNFKGFLSIQAHRVAHKLWSRKKTVSAYLIQSRVSEVFSVDIHPGAKIGRGILLDHATGVVIGETAVIGNNATIFHNVTLGGTGKTKGDRHPKVGDGVMIGAGAKVLGNVRIGDGAKIGAGSVVLKEVTPGATAVGNPARLVERKDEPVTISGAELP